MILVTGNAGYIGSVMTRVLQRESYQVIGLDCMYYEDCRFVSDAALPARQIRKDIRDLKAGDLEGVSAVIHLAALSNDPLGELNPSLTAAINADASVRLAELSKNAGIERFIFSSSCSVYRAVADSRPIDETGPVRPLTVYAKAKIDVERRISQIADAKFHPVFMRNATVYGVSPMLRLDLVVNKRRIRNVWPPADPAGTLAETIGSASLLLIGDLALFVGFI